MRKQKKWAKDEIPNEDLLYCYIHKCNLDKKTKQPLPRAFQKAPPLKEVQIYLLTGIIIQPLNNPEQG